jgi:hypothetical protein
MMRLLDALNDSNPLGVAVDDSFSGKSHFVDVSLTRVADLMTVDTADAAAVISESTVQSNLLVDNASEPFSSVADEPPSVALPAGTVAETIFPSGVSSSILDLNDWNTDEALVWFDDLVAS